MPNATCRIAQRQPYAGQRKEEGDDRPKETRRRIVGKEVKARDRLVQYIPRSEDVNYTKARYLQKNNIDWT